MNSTIAGLLAKLELARSVGFKVSPAAVWNYLMFRVRKHEGLMNLQKFGPFILNVLITRRCNFNCSFCIAVKQFGVDDAGNAKTYKDYEATPELFQVILDHPITKKTLAIHFIGGEPTLNKHLPYFVKETRKRGHLAVMTTNAIPLKDPDLVRELVSAGINRISVSLYEHSPSELKDILLTVNKTKRVNTTMVLTKTILDKRPESAWNLVELAEKSGCSDMFINCCTDVADGGTSPELIFDDDQNFIEFKRRTQERFPKFPIIWGLPVARIVMKDRHWCTLIWNGLTMDMAGNMGQCCAVYPDPVHPFGNFFTDTPQQILNHPTTVAMRSSLLNKNGPVHKRCATCSYLGNAWLSKR